MIIKENFKKYIKDISTNSNEFISKSIIFSIVIVFALLIIGIFSVVISLGSLFFFNVDNSDFGDFVFGDVYSPYSGLYASGFIALNTIINAFFALAIAIPISIFTAFFITKFLPKKVYAFFYSFVSILSSIPSVIYGAVCAIWLDQIIQFIFQTSSSFLTIILATSFMIVPTITLMIMNQISNIDKNLENISSSLGATKVQTNFKVNIIAAKKGIILGSIFALGKALGEATAISMIGATATTGPTINILQNVIILGPAILSISGGDGIWTKDIQLFTYTLSGLLFATTFIIFILINIFESYFNEEKISIRDEKKLKLKNSTLNKIKENSIDSLNKKEQIFYVNYQNKIEKNKLKDEKIRKKIIKKSILSKSQFETNIKRKEKSIINFKIKNSLKNKLLMTSFFSIFLLIFIFIFSFVFSSGFNYLNWEFISGKGIISENVYGLSVAIFGSIFSIFLTLLFAMPIGIIIGSFLALHCKESENLFNKSYSFIVQLLISVPTIIYGIVANYLFFNSKIDNNAKSLEAIFFFIIIVIPSIIKSTERNILDVSKQNLEISLSLGASKITTFNKVLLKESIPGIMSSAIFASAIIIGDSAIYITIMGNSSTATSNIDWIKNGGFTLSSQIYFLKNQLEVDWNQIKAICIVLIFIIFNISLLSKMLELKKYFEFNFIFISNFLIFISIIFNIYILFIFGFVILCISFTFVPFFIFIFKKYNLKERIYLKYEIRK